MSDTQTPPKVRIYIPTGELSGLAGHIHSKHQHTPLPLGFQPDIVEYHQNSHLNLTGVGHVMIIASFKQAKAVHDAFGPVRGYHAHVVIPKGGTLAALFLSMSDIVVTHHLDDFGEVKFRAAIWDGLQVLTGRPSKVLEGQPV